MYDVLIIGCGITGAAAAFELSKYHLSVAVLEQGNDVSGGTTKANSAILHAGYDPIPGSLMATLNVRGSALAEDLCRRLDVPYQKIGALVLGFSPADRSALEELLHRGNTNGVPGLALLDGDNARAMEPNLSAHVTCALHAPTAAICSPWEYALALAETAVQNDVALHLETAVVGMEQLAGGWRVKTNRGEFETRYVLNAAGISADRVHDLAAPHTFTIRPSRGEYCLLDKEEGNRVNRVIFQCPNAHGKGVLVAPTVHGNLIVGPNAQPVEGNGTATTADGLAYVQTTARRSVPSVNFRANIRSFAGVRAVADTGDFVIGEAAGAPGFFDLAGICSPGLTAAPAIAAYAVALLSQAGLALTRRTAFICARKRIRFQSLTVQEKTALVAQHPEYGHVICRCETVTEGELLDTFRAPIPPRSVDGVKRRVGAGAGRCQGGFCTPRVVALLTQALGVPPTELLQDGPGTWLLSNETKIGGEA